MNQDQENENLAAANANQEAQVSDADTDVGAETAVEIDPVEALVAENAGLKDQMLRLVADMENLRKRTAREIADTRSYAIANFARDMLTATDNLGRALMVVSQETRDTADATTKSLIDGIEMTDREMRRLLEKNGIAEIAANGQKFDPHKHQAMFEVPDTTAPEGIVVQVLQPGYTIGDRVLRPAMVGVAKGGPKPTPSAQDADEPVEDVASIRINKEV
jgi:molecular chaperone GrpE